MQYKNSDKSKQIQQNQTLNKIEENGHVFISGSYENRNSKLIIYCPKHDIENNTTFYNYNRSRTGCLFCGREQVSEKLTDRQFSEETHQKMIQSANKRPFRGGKPRRWRENQPYRNWRAAVCDRWDNECAVTGIKNKAGLGATGVADAPSARPLKPILIAHHLISAHSKEALALNVVNGILIHTDIHTTFHKNFNYTNNNVSQFKKFILLLLKGEIVMPISSQADSKESEGSETR